MHPRMQRLVFAATVVVLTACSQDGPVSPTDMLNPSEAGGATASYAVVLADGSTQLKVGESVTLRASTLVRLSRTVWWSSSNTSVVSVTSTGTSTGRAVGTATVTALGSNGRRSTFTIRVVSATTQTAAVVASVDITAPSPSMEVGSSMTLSATPRDSAGNWIPGRTATWSVSDGSAFTISATGVVTGVAPGSAVALATIDGVTNGRYLTVTGSTQTPTVTALAISPKTGATLAPAQTRQFSTTARWSDLATRAVSVTYSATGGTISSSGLYTAGQLAGTFMVIANCGCDRADTATVVVALPTTPTAQLTSLKISPESVSVAPGAAQQFSTAANWSTGATTLPPLSYSATGGTVSATGLYSAPTAAGTYRVIVAHTGGTLKDTATVVVIDGSTGVVTPPATTVGAGPNQPAGFTVIYSNPMGTLPPKSPATDVFGFQQYFGTSALSVRSETSVPDFLRATFPAGTAGGADYPNAFRAGYGFSSSGTKSRLYVRVRFRLSSNWTDNGNTGTKFFFFSQQQGNNHYVNLTEGGQFLPAVSMQSTFGFGTPSGPNHFVAQPLTKGVWHEMEILIVANTAGVYNGQVRIWVDGALMQSANDMGYFAAGTTPRFEEMYFNPTYGGGRNPVPADQYLDLDHWYVSGAP